MLVLAILNLPRGAHNTVGFDRDWNNDLISRFVNASSTANLQPYEYLDNWKFKYPGTVLGCYCPTSYSRRNVRAGVFTGECNRNQTISGCKQVSPTSPVQMSIWGNATTTYVVKWTNSSYNALRQNMRPDGTCVNGTMLCSDFCVPVQWKSCPVTRVQIGQSNPDPSLYTWETQYTGFNVYYGNDNQSRVITDITLGEYAVCVSNQTMATTPGRDPYPLVDTDYSSCLIDPRYQPLDSQDEPSLFSANNMNYLFQLPKYTTSQSYRWRRFTATKMDLNPNCTISFQSVEAQASKFLSRKTATWVLAIIAWVFMGLALIVDITQVVLCLAFACSQNREEVDKTFYTVLSIIKLGIEAVGIVLILVIFYLFKEASFAVYQIMMQQCIDAPLDSVYYQAYTEMKSKIFFRLVVTVFCNMGIVLLEYAWINVVYSGSENFGEIGRLA